MALNESFFIIDQLFSLSTFNYDLWNNYASHRSPALAESIVESHLDSLKAGSKKALKLFPNLLSFIEENYRTFPSILKKFTFKSLEVSPWLFVPWITQMLSMLGGCRDEVGRALGPVLLSVAEKYPEAIRFPFQFTHEHIVKSGSKIDSKQKPHVHQLQQKLNKVHLLDQLLAGMSNLCLPEVKAGYFLESISKDLRSPTLNREGKAMAVRQSAEKYKEEFEDNSIEAVGGSVHSTFYKKFKSELGKVIQLALKCSDEKALADEVKNMRTSLQSNR